MWEVAWSNADVICLSNYVGQSRMPLQSQEIRCALRSCCSVTLPSDPHTLVAEQCSLRKPCWFADSFLLVDKWEYILSYMTCFIVRLTGNGWCFEPFLWIGVTFALVPSLGEFSCSHGHVEYFLWVVYESLYSAASTRVDFPRDACCPVNKILRGWSYKVLRRLPFHIFKLTWGYGEIPAWGS